MRLFFWVAVLASSPALAQFTLAANDQRSLLTLGPGTCGDNLRISFTLSSTTTTTFCSELRLWITTSSSCSSSGPSTGDLELDPFSASEVTTNKTGTRTIKVSDLPIFTASDGGVTCGNGVDQEFRVCSLITTPSSSLLGCSSSTTSVTASNSLTIHFDGVPPSVPTIDSVTALDTALRVAVSTDSDAAIVRIGVRQLGSTSDFTFHDFSVSGDAVTGQIGDLTNGVTYEVVAKAVDAAGNESNLSAATQGTPIQTNGFWAAYRQAGGKDDGGCSATGGAVWGFWALLVLAGLARKRSALFAVALLALPARAELSPSLVWTESQQGPLTAPPVAQGDVWLNANQRQRSVESPRNSALEVKLGSYRPLIANEKGLTSDPYRTVFGKSGMLLIEVEYDYQFFQKMGSLAVAASVGYAQKFGHARDAVTGAITAETAWLRVFPARLLGVYRFDYAADHFHVPLVPYIKAGLVYTAWWAGKGGGVEYADGLRGAGSKWGYQGTAGLSLRLDFLEPRMARDFDTDLGINHSYLFAEYTYANVDNFGGVGMNLSSRLWMFGLALEF